jgi:transglutaminase-like putative cysteine protease
MKALKLPDAPLSARARRMLAIAAALAIAPQVFFIPLWLSLPCLALTLICAVSPPPELPKWWRVLLFLVLAASLTFIGLYFRRVWGREPGVSLLTVMVAAKLLEMRAPRDAMVVWCASAVLLVAFTTFDQEIPSLTYMLAVMTFLFAMLDVVHDGHDVHPVRAHTKQALKRLLLGVPIALVLFVLFPRLSAPLWGLAETNRGKTGLSETMRPGQISELVKSNEVAFRVEFARGLPNRDQLYWRGPVLDQFAVEGPNETWIATAQGPGQFVPLPSNIGASDTINYAVTLQPHQERWLFALDLPASYPKGARLESTTVLTRAQQLRHRFPIREPIRYEMASYPVNQFDADVVDIHRNLSTGPRALNPQSRAWAADTFERSGRNAREFVNAVLSHIKNSQYIYTTRPPLLKANMVDDFWFGTRRGFCEHYASAFVFLMRSVGVPARVVTGYQGGEVNPQNNLLVVRQSDAHAWAEVIVAGKWMRVDPTAAVAPQRIELDLSAALPASERSDFRNRESYILNFLRDTWDATQHTYTAWMLGYDRTQQLRALEKFGLAGLNPLQWIGTMLLLLVAAVAITVGLYSWREWVTRRNGAEFAEAIWLRFLQRARRYGIALSPAATPRSVRAELGFVPMAQRATFEHFLHLLERVRYQQPVGPHQLDTTRQDRRQIHRAYRALKFRVLSRKMRFGSN